MRRWKCKVCGYVHEGNEPPESCPVCGVPSTEFEEIPSEPNVASPVEETVDQKTVSDVMVETMVNWGVTHVFGMVGHSNLGLADAIRKQCEANKLKLRGTIKTPVYVTQARRNAMGKGLVFEADINTDMHPSHWVLQGVAMVLNTD